MNLTDGNGGGNALLKKWHSRVPPAQKKAEKQHNHKTTTPQPDE